MLDASWGLPAKLTILCPVAKFVATETSGAVDVSLYSLQNRRNISSNNAVKYRNKLNKGGWVGHARKLRKAVEGAVTVLVRKRERTKGVSG